MIYSILRRIWQSHLLAHLVIPLLVGTIFDLVYTWWVEPPPKWSWWFFYNHIASGSRIALYAGIFGTYLAIVLYFSWRDTNIGIRQLDLNVLTVRLRKATGLFAVGTMDFPEWFDPAVQHYLATIYERKRQPDQFRYERILLLFRRNAERHLSSEYLDGYRAKCLIHEHEALGIPLYFIMWEEISSILDKLTPQEKIQIGYYPKPGMLFPEWLVKLWARVTKRSRVRKVAVGLMEFADKSYSAFLFSKRDQIVKVHFYPEERVNACAHFVALINEKIRDPKTGGVRPEYDFTKFYAAT